MDNAGSHILMDLGQRATSLKFLIRDRAGQFTSSFDAVFTAEGIRVLASPPQAPRANAICERIIGTRRRELADRLLIVNEHHLRRVPTEYLRHYNAARPHRSLASSPLPKPIPSITGNDAGGLGSQEQPPRQRHPPRRRPQPASGHNPPDRPLPHPVPKAGQLALDAPAPPARVLPCQPPHQHTKLTRDGTCQEVVEQANRYHYVESEVVSSRPGCSCEFR